MNFCTIQRRCRNLLCFRLDARISNILIFMRHFVHQTNKNVCLHSLYFRLCQCFKYKSGLKKTDMHVVSSQHSIAAHAKIREALADASKSIRQRIENKQWTYCSSFMSKTWFYSLAPLFWFFCFLIRNFNSFCSSFYYCNWRKNSHHHAYSRHHAN